MKKLIIIILVFIYFDCIGQNIKNDSIKSNKEYKEVKLFEGDGFVTLDRWAMYPGGKEGIDYYISQNLKYPKKAIKKKIEGKVILSFLIQTDGSIGEIIVVQSVHELLDEEAVRVIKGMEKWKPALQNGKKIKIRYKQEFNFNIK